MSSQLIAQIWFIGLCVSFWGAVFCFLMRQRMLTKLEEEERRRQEEVDGWYRVNRLFLIPLDERRK